MFSFGIKRCPWCRGTNVFSDSDGSHVPRYWVSCGDCGATGGNQKTMDMSIKQWNDVSDAVESWGVFYECYT